MKKDFTISVEVRLFAHWNAPMDKPEEWERRKAVDDRLGVIACDFDEVVRVMVENQFDLVICTTALQLKVNSHNL